MPSVTEDISVRAFRRDGAERRSYAAPALAAAIFLLSVRGLPLTEVSADTPAGKFEIQSAENNEKYSIILPKCKVLCANMSISVKNTEIKYSDVASDKQIVRAVKCSDAELFDDAILPRLLLREDGEMADISLAFSLSQNKVSAKLYSNHIYPEEALLKCAHAISALLPQYERAEIYFGEDTLYFCRAHNGIAFSSDIPPPMTASAEGIIL